MDTPYFSIITPLYRAQGFVAGLVQTLQQQTFSEWELLLIPDDGADYSHVLQVDHRIRLIDRGIQNTRAGPARNAGFDAAQGQYLVMLDHDDELQSNYLQAFYDHFTSTGDLAAISPTECIEQATGQKLYSAGEDFVGRTMSIGDFAWLLASAHVVVRREHSIPSGAGYAEDVLRDALLLNTLGPLQVLDTRYRLITHTQQNTQNSSEQDIRDAYRAYERDYALIYPEVAKVFEIRHAANLVFSQFSPTRNWYRFWGAIQTLGDDWIRSGEKL